MINAWLKKRCAEPLNAKPIPVPDITHDKAQRIAVNIAKLPELLHPTSLIQILSIVRETRGKRLTARSRYVRTTSAAIRIDDQPELSSAALKASGCPRQAKCCDDQKPPFTAARPLSHCRSKKAAAHRTCRSADHICSASHSPRRSAEACGS
jgi:hypothetical protein